MNTIDGVTFKNMMKYGVHILDENMELLNSLNIFPVPDGDTGTNMSLTSIAAIKELDKLAPEVSCDEAAAAVASGSLRGARGNSGVILSQLFRGFSKGIKGKNKLTTVDFANALLQSAETAYKAVMKPKEGTVLTVARESAQFASEIAANTEDFEDFLKRVVERSYAVLEMTTNMLPALKAAGVVDAGGKGLVHIYEGFYEGLTKQCPESHDASARKSVSGGGAAASNDTDIKFAYCTEFIIEYKDASDKVMKGLTDYLETIGDSIVAVCDEQIIKIHVHTNSPGNVIERAIKIGPLSSVKVENMRFQHTELTTHASTAAPASKTSAFTPEIDKTNKNIGIITISAGEGINNIFRELGCDCIIEGGQTMNPSADDIYKAAEQISKQNLIILPNNKNIILAAKQAAALLEKEKGRAVKVLETKSIPQGIGAMIAMLHDRPLNETADTMEAGAKYVKTGQVTIAVRDTEINGKSVKKGDYIGIIDGEIEIVEKSSLQAGKKVIERFSEDCEIITIYYSEKGLESEGSQLYEYVGEFALECELHYGGQPVYTYVISAE